MTEATHINGNRLDLVLSSGDDLVREVSMEGRLGHSDHEVMSILIQRDAKRRSSEHRYRDFNRANYDEAKVELKKVKWEEELEEASVEETWEKIKGKLMEIVEKWVPWREKKDNMRPKWFNREVKWICRKKKEAWNRWKRTREEEDLRKYKELERETKGLIRRRKKGLEKMVAKEAKKNPKSFFSYINAGRKMRNKIGPLKAEGEIVVDPKRQANVLNAQYASVFTKSAGEIPKKMRPAGIPDIVEVCFDEVRVKTTIERLKEQSAPGPDAIPNKLIKETMLEIAKPLSILFNKSLRERKIPDEWRVSNITPIYKKGPKSEPGNYRPVNLTSAVCKLMERVVKDELEVHLEQNSLIGASQHGF